MLLVAAAMIVFAVAGKKAGWFGKAATVKVAVETVERRTVVETITANGKIQPEREVKLSPDVSGEIVELTVKEGDMVEKGQLLLRIKPDTYISQKERSIAALSSAKARLSQAEAQLVQAGLSYRRSRQLFSERTISESDFEQAEATHAVAKAEADAALFSVISAEASLKEADENLTKTLIYAPMSGTVSMLLVEPGERVAGTNLMAGTEMLRVADLSRMETRVEVNENDIVKVKLGDTAIIEVDAYIGSKFRGVVTEIANSARAAAVATDQVTNFDVKILVLPESYRSLSNPFRPGMSATAGIQTTKRTGAVTVPIQSVTTRVDTLKTPAAGSGSADEPRLLVFVTDGQYALAKDVETGIQDDNYIEITSGIEQGERVISAPYSAVSRKLMDSTLIEITDRDKLFSED
ncbi:MAG: efflux RND transporter periplasmic adaptor subunit [Bacteroidales bacterium]|nr:efflux RND transporter periplasmic adaptor subunit [Bacteroidales bacterium]